MHQDRRPLLAAALFTALFFASGCTTVTEQSAPRTQAPVEPTALIIADERGPLSAEELEARRPVVIQYLVSRGYLSGPDALVDNPAAASRFIRVVFSAGGGFRITEFTLGNRSRQLVTSGYIPGHSDSYGEYGRYGYYNYYQAQPYLYEVPVAYSPAPPYSPPPDRPQRRYRRYDGGDRNAPHRPPHGDRADRRDHRPDPTPPPSATPPQVEPAPRTELPPAPPAEREARFEEHFRPNQP